MHMAYTLAKQLLLPECWIPDGHRTEMDTI
jgi:hypothetical protein